MCNKIFFITFRYETNRTNMYIHHMPMSLNSPKKEKVHSLKLISSLGMNSLASSYFFLIKVITIAASDKTIAIIDKIVFILVPSFACSASLSSC